MAANFGEIFRGLGQAAPFVQRTITDVKDRERQKERDAQIDEINREKRRLAQEQLKIAQAREARERFGAFADLIKTNQFDLASLSLRQFFRESGVDPDKDPGIKDALRFIEKNLEGRQDAFANVIRALPSLSGLGDPKQLAQTLSQAFKDPLKFAQVARQLDEAAGPQSGVGREQFDVSRGLITQEQLDASRAGRSPNITIQNIPPGNKPLEKPTKGEVEKSLVSQEESLSRLEAIGGEFEEQFLTIQGRTEAAVARGADFVGLSTSAQKALIGKRRKFVQTVEREFNQYRREITGAAASVQELSALKNATINTDLSPAEFRASFESYVEELRRGIRIKRKLLREGVNINDPEFGDRFDRAFLAGEEKPITEVQRDAQGNLVPK